MPEQQWAAKIFRRSAFFLKRVKGLPFFSFIKHDLYNFTHNAIGIKYKNLFILVGNFFYGLGATVKYSHCDPEVTNSNPRLVTLLIYFEFCDWYSHRRVLKMMIMTWNEVQYYDDRTCVLQVNKQSPWNVSMFS